MASEIRVDKINSLSGVGTVTLSPTGVDIAGITTAATLRATTGIVTSLTAGSLTSLSDVKVGSGVTLSPDGDVSITGVTTFTGHIDASSDVFISDKIIHAGDTDTTIRFPAANTVSVETGGAERLEISNSSTIFNDAGADIDFRIESDTKDSMFFLDAGNNRIGINNSSPACIFDILDTSTSGDGITEILKLNGAANNNNDGVKLTFARVNSESCSITAKKVLDNNTTDLIFNTRSGNTVAEKFRMKGDGDLSISDGNLVIATSGHGIDFSATGDGSGTDSSELLDDYEEGSWTPTITGGAITASGAYYTKIGRAVHWLSLIHI